MEVWRAENPVFVSGGWDNAVKVWGGRLAGEEEVLAKESQAKRAKPSGRCVNPSNISIKDFYKEHKTFNVNMIINSETG